MKILLLGSGLVAIITTIATIAQKRAVHALLYLIVSFLSLAVSIFALGATFSAVLEIVVYAGAILVFFVIVVMILGQEKNIPSPNAWLGPSILVIILLVQFLYAILSNRNQFNQEIIIREQSPKEVGVMLFGQYAICTELAAFLLLAALAGAFHLGRGKLSSNSEDK